MSTETITLDFDGQLTDVLLQYYDVKRVLKSLLADESIPQVQKEFFVENTTNHLSYLESALNQVVRERTT